MKLELKHLASYLPYGLECYGIGEATPESEGTDDEKPKLFKIEGMNNTWVEVSGRLETVTDEIHIEDCIPHLIPLSALIEPEYEKVLDEFSEMEYDDLLDRIDYVKIGLQKSENVCNNLRFETINALFANHFDVYGLIDAGLAIDKRTLK